VSVILVADEMAAIREPVAAALCLEGYETLCASDGRQALEMARQHKPDLLILDSSLPVMDGIECLRALRRSRETADIPVILLSGGIDRAGVAEAARLKVKDYLLKSDFSLPDLLQRVKQRVGKVVGELPAPPPPPAAGTSPLFDRHLRKRFPPGGGATGPKPM
jgi:CheY-like chemotaxis protein